MFRQLLFACIVVLFGASVSFADSNDTMTVRLRSGARLRGVIAPGKDGAITVTSSASQRFDVHWDDVLYISAPGVFDSLTNSRGVIAQPLAAEQLSWFERSNHFSLLLGSEFKYHRGFGIGARNALQFTDAFSAGILGVFHFGDDEIKQTSASRPLFVKPVDMFANGPIFYWGPEVALSLGSDVIKIDLHYSVGQAIVDVYTNGPYNSSKTTETDFFHSPALGARFDVGGTYFGVEFRSLNIRSTHGASLFFMIGN